MVSAFNEEMIFSVNVLGHHLLTELLVDLLKNGSHSRIINVASHFAGGPEADDVSFDRRKYNPTSAYKQSKQANRMLTRKWARQLKNYNISVYSMTPGFIPSTDLFRNQSFVGKIFLKIFGLIEGKTVQQGADTIVWLASAENIDGSTGGFFKERKEKKRSVSFSIPMTKQSYGINAKRFFPGFKDFKLPSNYFTIYKNQTKEL